MSTERTNTKALFQQWLAIPKGMRADKTGLGTQKEFAQKHNVTPTTLSRWKQDPDFMDAVEHERNKRLDRELSEVYQALIDEAISGNMDAIRFAFKLTGRYSEKTTVRHESSSGEDAKALSDDALAERFASAISKETGADQDQVKGAVMNALNPTAAAEEAPADVADDGEEKAAHDEADPDSVSDEDTSEGKKLDEIDELLMDDEFEPDYS